MTALESEPESHSGPAAGDAPVLPVTLILVSDFEPGEKTWADEIAAADAFLGDPSGVPAEILILETEGDTAPPPPALLRHGARLRVERSRAEGSAALKDAAVPLARFDLAAVVEADCAVRPGWLAAVHARIQADDRPDVVSGRTVYPGDGASDGTSDGASNGALDGALRRVMGLMDRGFAEIPMAGGRWHVSNNAALYRIEALRRFPYPQETDEDLNPFVSAERRQNAMHAAGLRTAFAPQAACE
ncbi:MAG: glycosyltransferase family A protein, partial [Pseudomonadota bacterium]